MRSGKKSLEEAERFLEALANQLLNESAPDCDQQLEVFGVMCARTTVSADMSPTEVEEVRTRVAQHRGMQAAPILYAKAVVRNLIKEYDRSEQVPASEVVSVSTAAGVRHWTVDGDFCDRTDCSCPGRNRSGS